MRQVLYTKGLAVLYYCVSTAGLTDFLKAIPLQQEHFPTCEKQDPCPLKEKQKVTRLPALLIGQEQI